MTTTAAPPAAPYGPEPDETSADPVTSAPVHRGVQRLHPVDGLFLRSEHLDKIQDYAGTLTRLAAQADGGGTVYGFELDLDTNPNTGTTTLTAKPGFAVAEDGGLLRSTADLDVDLAKLTTGVPGRFWVVEVVPAEPEFSGQEPAYTSVCATTCGSDRTVQPWEDERVMLRVRPDWLADGWDTSNQRRSALASAWFERERERGRPWLTPIRAGMNVRPTGKRSWARPAPLRAPAKDAVPLGLLFVDKDNKWVVDVWAARRDLVAPPPEESWMPRLSMRSWRTYVAQLLQFQDHVSDLVQGPEALDHLVELPPGGFLDMSFSVDEGSDRRGSGKARLKAWRGKLTASGMDVRVHRTSADVAIRAVAEAQHLDRIPVQRDGDGTAIDLWVPAIPADLPRLETESYRWIAFTRGVRVKRKKKRRGAPAPAPEVVVDAVSTSEEVAVFVTSAPRERARYGSGIDRVGDGDRVTALAFGPESWSLDDQASLDELRNRVQGHTNVDVVVTTQDEAREPLVVARGGALAAGLGLSEPGRTGVFPVRRDGPDAIYLMVRS